MSLTPRHRVRLESAGTLSRLFIDDVDISRNVTGIDLHVDSRNGPRMTLDVGAFPLDVEMDDVAVWPSSGTAELLIALGWTPPEEPEEGLDVLD